MFAGERASGKLLLRADVRNKKARIYIDARLGGRVGLKPDLQVA
jgi:hypothetical protein